MAGRGTDIVLGGNFTAMVDDKLLKEGIDPDEITMPDKKKRYAELAQELEQEHKKVVEAGGLHIVGTERHDSRRIDNQLRGRAGRQGDPGSSRFFLSLDDDLMRIFGSGRIATMMDKLGVEEGEVISHPIVSRSIQNAQKKVEARNFEQRKHLKEYDDVMNYQRSEIYSLRQKVVTGDSSKDEIFEQMAAYLEDTIYSYTSNSSYPEEWQLKELAEDLQITCGIVISDIQESISEYNQESLFDALWKKIEARYEERERHFGEELMRQVERSVFLMVIDNLWKDHLYEMDHLKEGVQYRAFGQKNPLYEYQREALQIFEQLRKNISKQTTSSIFRVEASLQEEDVMGLENARTTHAEFDVYTSGDQASGSRTPTASRATAGMGRQQMITNRGEGKKPQPVRTEKKAGRNDPCPCGSGKKYKKCCGAS
jgi:preprotein translocase subunit SecA